MLTRTRLHEHVSDIFISYSREDRGQAERLAHAFEAEGWSVWWDRIIPAGRNFDDVIEEQIDAARCIIVLWSNHSVGSRWVKTEAQAGLDRGVLVPVVIELVDKIPLAFRQVQAADLIGWDGAQTDKAFQQMVRDMGRILGPPPRLQKEEEQRQSSAKRQAEEEQQRAIVAEASAIVAEARQKAEREEHERRAAVDAKNLIDEEERRPIIPPIKPATAEPRPAASVEPKDRAQTIAEAFAHIELERVLPAALFVLILIIEWQAGTFSWHDSLTRFWSTIFCALGAAIVSAVGVSWPKRRLVITGLAVASFTDPVISFLQMRQMMWLVGSAPLVVLASQAAHILAGVPFVLIAGLSLALAMLPRWSAKKSRHTAWILALLAMICAMSSVDLMRAFHGMTLTGVPPEGVAKQILDLVK
jgi:TIR domain